jgi:DNA integrity scanning protein DisA with diadenylate cyclase activity
VVKYIILMVILILIVSYMISYTYTLITGEYVENIRENSFSWILASTLLYVNNSMLRLIVDLCRTLWFPILSIGILLYFIGLRQLGYKIVILSLLLLILPIILG